MMEMFFYRIGAIGYEESYTTTYMSEVKYTQKEFEDMVLSAYEKLCYQILKDKEDSPCFWSIYFSVEYSIFSEDFNRIMEEDYGLVSLTKMLNGRVIFDLTHNTDSRSVYHNEGVYDVLSNLDFDMSCYEKDCSRLHTDKVRDRKRCREDCLVHIFKDNKSIEEELY